MINENHKIIIAIDGHSSCGKSTVAKEIARKLNYIFIDTGAMYRAITLFCLRNQLIINGVVDVDKLGEKLGQIQVAFFYNQETNHNDIWLNGENVENEIRLLTVSQNVSPVAAVAQVRHLLVALQQKMGQSRGIVMDGRDIGTVVFPDADLKIFMTANPDVRAKRRFDELVAKGEKVSFDEIRNNIIERDHYDENREESPLVKAVDAIVLDNSYMTREEQLNWILDKIYQIQKGLVIEIDQQSGFCFGVVEAIRKAEETLKYQDTLYCLGDIVHNDAEVDRLTREGLITIDHERFFSMKDAIVLLRAHGEPPETYEYARQNNIRLIDATCPVVLKLQQRIRKGYESDKSHNTQFVIYGKKGHAEVNGLVGQTNGEAIVLENWNENDKLDYSRPIELYSQTTKDLEGFHLLAEELKKKSVTTHPKIHDTVCRQVANRIPAVRKFAGRFDLVLFVSGQKSSNGKMLYGICQTVNKNSKFISSVEDIDLQWLRNIGSVGICGATSTPKKLLEEVAQAVRNLSR